MPKVSLADSVTDWNNLIANASLHSADDPSIARWLEELRDVLEQALETEALRLRLEAERQVATRTLADAKKQGKVLAIRLRSQLKAIYGPTSQSLHRFGIRPRPHPKGAPANEIQLPAPSSPAARNPEE